MNPPEIPISYNEYSLIFKELKHIFPEGVTQIGSGSFGRCFKYKDSGGIKVVKIVFTRSEEELEKATKEARLVSPLDHRNIVKVLSFLSYKGKILLIMMPYYTGNLRKLLITADTIPKKTRVHILADILEGLSYIHSRGLIHRDIKPENILFDENSNFIISDFGLTRYLEDNETAETFCGTRPYIAPEIALKGHYDAKVDVYAAGCILYELKYQNILSEAIKDGTFQKNMSKKCKLNDLISGMVNPDPSKRLTAKECLSHPYISNNKTDDPIILPSPDVSTRSSIHGLFKFLKLEKLADLCRSWRSSKHIATYPKLPLTSKGDTPAIHSMYPGFQRMENISYRGDRSITNIFIPGSVRKVPPNNFESCSYLTGLIFEEGVKEIGNNAFKDCDLTSVTLPESLETIGDFAFCGCFRLEKIVIQKNVREIGVNPFYGCNALNKIELRGNERFIFRDNFLIKRESGELIAYLGKDLAELRFVEIPEDVKRIKRAAFEGCRRRLVLRLRRKVDVNEDAFGGLKVGMNYID